MTYPYVVWIGIMIVVPMLLIMLYAFTVDGNDVTMLEDSGSKNAHAPLSVVNTKGFDLPATGDHGVWMYGLAGILLMAGSITSIIIGCRKKSNKK